MREDVIEAYRLNKKCIPYLIRIVRINENRCLNKNSTEPVTPEVPKAGRRGYNC
jgi:hypothetical protein